MARTASEARVKSVAPVEKWRGEDAGRRYASLRFGSRRAAQRDPGLVRDILLRHGATSLLDAPCGSGRLLPVLSRGGIRSVGVDVSAAMLTEGPGGRCLQAALEHLPFRDGTFDVVVCCRLLHHLGADELGGVLSELCRVSSRLVVASFWDAASLPALRRRLVRGRTARDDAPERTRRPLSKAKLEEAFASNGARVLEYRHSFRFLSRQTFVVAGV